MLLPWTWNWWPWGAYWTCPRAPLYALRRRALEHDAAVDVLQAYQAGALNVPLGTDVLASLTLYALAEAHPNAPNAIPWRCAGRRDWAPWAAAYRRIASLLAGAI